MVADLMCVRDVTWCRRHSHHKSYTKQRNRKKNIYLSIQPSIHEHWFRKWKWNVYTKKERRKINYTKLSSFHEHLNIKEGDVFKTMGVLQIALDLCSGNMLWYKVETTVAPLRSMSEKLLAVTIHIPFIFWILSLKYSDSLRFASNQAHTDDATVAPLQPTSCESSQTKNV